MLSIVTIVLMLASFALSQNQVQAQEDNIHGGVGGSSSNGSIALPSGVTADVIVTPTAYLSFQPNPIGVGQILLVNMWLTPPTSVTRYLTGLTVTITKPDGTQDKVNTNTYYADGTSWFEYNVDQAGTWKLKFDFPGGYFPKGNYTVVDTLSPLYPLPYTETFTKSCYYKPASTSEQTLIVQNDMVASWPPAALPTGYWTRPAVFENREWVAILGDFPWRGPGGGANWPANTNPYWSNSYSLTPYVQAPNSAHIVWKRVGAISGLIGEGLSYEALTSAGGSPNIVFQGRCYQSIAGVSTSGTGSQNFWQCYDLRTGQVYWQRPVYSGETLPAVIEYDTGTSETPGAEARAGAAVAFVSLPTGYLIKYNPTTGAVSANITIPTFTTSTYYMNGYVLSVQTINTTGGPGAVGTPTAGQYRLINWTTIGTNTNFNNRIISNITWPRNSIGSFIDWQTGISFVANEIDFFDLANMGFPYVDLNFDNATGIRYGTRIKAYDLVAGKEIWDVSVPDNSIYSSSASVADHGKVAIFMRDGPYGIMAWDEHTGKLAWTSPKLDYPWDAPGFGAYAIQSAYGYIYREAYSGVYAVDWSTGKIAWKYEAPAVPFETPYTNSNGTNVYSWNSGGVVADGKIYLYNTEHTPTAPITRGWGLHCINATTGKGIWNITTPGAIGAVSDGYISVSCTDGVQYIFGKGKSSTTVSAPQTEVALGTGVMIAGTVLDQSPAQTGSPCVSVASMTTEMEYLHKQQPIDGIWHNETIAGVKVSLDAVDPNHNPIHIGDVTTEGYSGTFGYRWQPQIAGQYTVTATFIGDGSYGSSFATTYLSVSETPTTSPAATANVKTSDILTPLATYIAVGVIAIIIAVAIATVVLLRKKT